VLPGPNVLNLCIILGSQYFGLAGAVVATAGILLAPFVVVLVVAALFTSVSDLAMVQGALRGLSVVVAGVIMATALRMTPALKSNPLGKWLVWGLVAATVLLVGVLHVRLIWVLMGLGSIACWLAARQLRALEANKESKA
jgi:chromate transporter